MSKISTVRVADERRVELHDQLALTGCEVSVNNLAAHEAIPFVHYHDQNEEVYLILSGDGLAWLDGEFAEVAEGDCFKVTPTERRCIKAGSRGLRYICIQCRENSLNRFTMADGKLAEGVTVDWPA